MYKFMQAATFALMEAGLFLSVVLVMHTIRPDISSTYFATGWAFAIAFRHHGGDTRAR